MFTGWDGSCLTLHKEHTTLIELVRSILAIISIIVSWCLFPLGIPMRKMQLTKESMASSAQVFDSANISIRFSVWQLENLLKSIVPPVDRDRRVWHLLKLQIKIIIYTFAINKMINKKTVVWNISIRRFVFYLLYSPLLKSMQRVNRRFAINPTCTRMYFLESLHKFQCWDCS